MILPSQLTIIFGGSFSVFDGIPAEKVWSIQVLSTFVFRFCWEAVA
jgi:hypothetical protein